MLKDLGEVSGTVVVDVSRHTYFKGELVGNAVLEIVNASAGRLFFIDLTQGNGGAHSVDFGGGMDVVPNLASWNVQTFVPGAVGVGARSVGLWTSDGADLIPLGYNATQPS